MDSFEDLFRVLYEKAEEYLPGKEGTIAILVNEHMFQASHIQDKEINAASLLYNIMKLK